MPVRTHLLVPGFLIVCAGVQADGQAPPKPAPQSPADHMHHAFDDPARWAKDFDDPARDAWQMPERVIAALDLKAGQKVADIGAGTGYFSTRLARAAAAPTVYAVDVEPAMVKHLAARAAAEKLPNLLPVHAAADSPRLPSPVHTVLIVDTYHHIPGRVEYFRRLRSALEPGGRVAVIDFRKDAPEGPPPEFRFSPEQITAEMAEAGYRVAARHDFLPRQLFLVFEATARD